MVTLRSGNDTHTGPTRSGHATQTGHTQAKESLIPYDIQAGFRYLGKKDPNHGRRVTFIKGTNQGLEGVYLEATDKRHKILVKRLGHEAVTIVKRDSFEFDSSPEPEKRAQPKTQSAEPARYTTSVEEVSLGSASLASVYTRNEAASLVLSAADLLIKLMQRDGIPVRREPLVQWIEEQYEAHPNI